MSSASNSIRFPARSGFTILEVMLATTIFALVVVALAVSLNRSIEFYNMERVRTTIRQTLESKLAEFLVEAQRDPLTPSNDWKEIGKADPGIVYERQVLLKNLKNRKKEPLPDLYSVTLRARWMEAGINQTDSVELLIRKAQ